ncbi:hypothetical protein, partial [Caldithrix abyssi]
MAVQSDGIEYENGAICLRIHSGAEFYFWGCLKSQRQCIFIKFFFPSPPLIPPLPKIAGPGTHLTQGVEFVKFFSCKYMGKFLANQYLRALMRSLPGSR